MTEVQTPCPNYISQSENIDYWKHNFAKIVNKLSVLKLFQLPKGDLIFLAWLFWGESKLFCISGFMLYYNDINIPAASWNLSNYYLTLALIVAGLHTHSTYKCLYYLLVGRRMESILQVSITIRVYPPKCVNSVITGKWWAR